MDSLGYALRRILWSIVALVGLSVIIFTLSRVVPGDPARMALGPQASAEAVLELRKELHLDEPLYKQYIYWLSHFIRGDFGLSLMTMRSVTQDIKEFFPATLELVLVAAFFQIFFGITLGVLSAASQGKWVDNLFRVFAYVGVVTPAFVFATLFMLLFGYVWPVLPVLGRTTQDLSLPPITRMIVVDSLIRGDLATACDALAHMILPALALAMNGLSQLARVTRSAMSDNIGRDYVVMETAQGIGRGTIFFKYLLRPSIIPTISVIALQFATLFSNAFLVELIFNWPGLSRYGVQAMLFKDLNAVSAVVCISGLVFILANIVVDILVAMLDPRIRLKAGE